MMSKTKFNYVLIVICTLSSINANAQEVNSEIIAFACNTCHSSDNQSEYPGVINLKAKPKNELVKQLLDFKYDRQASSIMGRITKGYSDVELQAVAHYFSRLQ